MRNVGQLLLVSVAGVLLYLAAYSIKRRLFPADIALTEGGYVLLALLPLFIVALVLLAYKKFLAADACIAAFLIVVLTAICFNLTVPSVFDRSVSLYLLNTLDNAADGLTETQIRDEFVDVYFGDNHGIRKRLIEQIQMGNVRHDGERYRMTHAGRRMVGIVRFFNRVYNLDPQMAKRKAVGG